MYGATKMGQGRLKGWSQGGLTSPLSRLEGDLPALASCRQMVPAARRIPSLPAPEPRSFGAAAGPGLSPQAPKGAGVGADLRRVMGAAGPGLLRHYPQACGWRRLVGQAGG